METSQKVIYIVYVQEEQDVAGQVVTVFEVIHLGLTDLDSLTFVQQEAILVKMTVEDGGVILVVRLVLVAHKFSELITEFLEQLLGEKDHSIVQVQCFKLQLTRVAH
jgi:hypothetical protein